MGGISCSVSGASSFWRCPLARERSPFSSTRRRPAVLINHNSRQQPLDRPSRERIRPLRSCNVTPFPTTGKPSLVSSFLAVEFSRSGGRMVASWTTWGCLGLRIEPLGPQLVVHEPAVRALDPGLERPGPHRVALGQLGEDRGVRQWSRKHRLDTRRDRRDSALELATTRRFVGPEHHPVEPMDLLELELGLIGDGANRSSTSSMNGDRVLGRPSSSELRHDSHRRSVGRETHAWNRYRSSSTASRRASARRSSRARRSSPSRGSAASAPGKSPSWSEARKRCRARAARTRYGLNTRTRPSVGPLQSRTRSASSASMASSGSGARAAGHPVELGELLQHGRGGLGGPDLEGLEGDFLAWVAHTEGHRLRPRMAILGEPPSGDREGAEPGCRASRVANRRERHWDPAPVVEDLIHRLGFASADGALDPVRDPLSFRAQLGPHEVEQVPCARVWKGAVRQGQGPAPDSRSRKRYRCFDRHGDAEAFEDLPVQRPAAIRVAHDDHDLIGIDAIGQQPSDLRAYGLDLAALAPALQEGRGRRRARSSAPPTSNRC